MTTVQLSYACGSSQVPMLGTTIGATFDAVARAGADLEALVECASGRRFTYRQLAEQVDAVALGLKKLGVNKGDRVGIWSPNCAEWVFVQLATAKLGALLVTINPAYRAHELGYVLNQAGIRTLFAAPAFRRADYAAMIDEVRPGCTQLRDVVLIGRPEWYELLERGKHADRSELARIDAIIGADDPINIQYTSGTTGFPKGVTLSHHNILNNGYFVGRLCGYTNADRVAIPVPLYHCFGMVMGVLGAITWPTSITSTH